MKGGLSAFLKGQVILKDPTVGIWKENSARCTMTTGWYAPSPKHNYETEAKLSGRMKSPGKSPLVMIPLE